MEFQYPEGGALEREQLLDSLPEKEREHLK